MGEEEAERKSFARAPLAGHDFDTLPGVTMGDTDADGNVISKCIPTSTYGGSRPVWYTRGADGKAVCQPPPLPEWAKRTIPPDDVERRRKAAEAFADFTVAPGGRRRP